MEPGSNLYIHLKNLTLEQLTSTIIDGGEPRFRARQIVKWLYQKRVGSFNEMTTLSKSLRDKLATTAVIDKMECLQTLHAKEKDAVKFEFKLINSPHTVESVLLIDGKRRTACISSQLGCGLGCVFCATGKMGFIRNLSQEEIVGQLIGMNDFLALDGDKLITNVVFMGMGEALSNFEAFRSSLDIIMNEDTFNIGSRRITVSTAGVIPSIERLISENLTIGLAISLNAFSDRERDRLMPINRKYPIASLVEIAKRYYKSTGRRVTFEYVLIAGETDTSEAAAELNEMLGGFPCKINLIPLNPHGNISQKSTTDATLTWFMDELHRKGLSATVRKSRGKDICGACGQLAGNTL